VAQVYKLYEQGKITPVVDSTWAFEDIPEAMQKMHDRKNIGKITIDPAQEAKPRPPEEDTSKSSKRKSSAKEKSEEKKEPEKATAEPVKEEKATEAAK
jgi:uncharacterized protein (DUF39 family)